MTIGSATALSRGLYELQASIHDDPLLAHTRFIIEPGRFLADRYAELALDGTAEIRQALELLAAAGGAPVVIHCAAGKDRTGVLTALALALLGVTDDDIVADYALTGLVTDRLIAEWRAHNRAKTLRWPGFGQAPAAAMRLFLAGLTAEYGGVRSYAATRLGVDDRLVGELRAQFLTG